MLDSLRSTFIGICSSVGFNKWKLKKRLGHKFTRMDEIEAMREWRPDDWKKVCLDGGSFDYYMNYNDDDFAKIYVSWEDLASEANMRDDMEDLTYKRLFLNHLETYRQVRKHVKDCGWSPPPKSLKELVLPQRKAKPE